MIYLTLVLWSTALGAPIGGIYIRYLIVILQSVVANCMKQNVEIRHPGLADVKNVANIVFTIFVLIDYWQKQFLSDKMKNALLFNNSIVI